MKSKKRHLTLEKRARIVDFIIDHYKKVRGRKSFPKKILADIVPLIFPGSDYKDRGFFKVVHTVHSPAHKRVLKLSHAKSTKRDWEVYRRLPANIRNRYFAKIYWHTKYCLLQKYGKKVAIPERELQKLRKIGKKCRIMDIKKDNVRKVDGHFKIIDANPS